MLARMPKQIVGTVLFASLTLIVCGGQGCRVTNEDPPPKQPRRGGKVIIGALAPPKGVNELADQVSVLTTEMVRQLFLQLVKEQPNFESGPPRFETSELAESFDFSPDRKAITFKLRDGVKWSDGKPVTANDVRFTWEAQRNTDINWRGAYMKKPITDVEVVDSKTVRFHFSHVYAKQMADANEGVILPKHVWGQKPFKEWKTDLDWFRHNLVVSGPFKIDSWSPQEVVLVRNPLYFKTDRPYLDKAVIFVAANSDDLIAKFNEGEIDFLPQIAPDNIASVSKSGAKLFPRHWHRLLVCVVWNVGNPKFSSAGVRRALTMAINRQAIVDANFPDDMGRVGLSPILQSIWAFNPALRRNQYNYNSAESAHALESYGWKDTDGNGTIDKNGEDFTFTLLANEDNQQRVKAAQMIGDDLKQVGISVTPKAIAYNSLIELAEAKQFDAMIFGYTIDTSLDMTGQFSSNADLNFGGYNNPEFDDLMAVAMNKATLEAAKPHLFRIQEIIHHDQPVTFLWESKRLSAIRPRVQDARPNALFALYNLQDWWVK